jgi:hypothetical protein
MHDKGKGKCKVFDKITAFGRQLRLWGIQLQSNNMTHFAVLRKEMPTDAKK